MLMVDPAHNVLLPEIERVGGCETMTVVVKTLLQEELLTMTLYTPVAVGVTTSAVPVPEPWKMFCA
jgi:hypothetical protein